MVKVLNISMFAEYVHLATRIANQTLSETICTSLSQKYAITPIQAQRLLADVAALEEKMVPLVDATHPDFLFFFQNTEGQPMSLAQSLLILFENKDEIPVIEPDQWQLFFTVSFTNFLSEDSGDDIKKGQSLSKEELLNRIIRSDLPETLKYRLLILMENPIATMRKCFDMYESVRESWLRYRNDLENLSRKSMLTYQSMTEDELITSVEKTVSIQSIPRNQAISMAPSVFNYNSLSFIDFPWYKSDADAMIWYIGIKLFDIFEKINSTSDQKQRLTNALKVLSDQSKLEILMLCKEEPQYGVNLAKQLKLTTATVSYHLNALVNLGYLSLNMEGNRIYYRTQKERVQTDLRAITTLFE